MVTDLLGQELVVGDYVVSFNNVYRVIALKQRQYVRLMLLNPSKTTRPVNRYSREVCKLDATVVDNWNKECNNDRD